MDSRESSLGLRKNYRSIFEHILAVVYMYLNLGAKLLSLG